MMTAMIYLDHNATTPVSPQVLEAMLPFFRESFGNASSFYRVGRAAGASLAEARAAVAECIGASAQEIVFTGSGTEADNLALRGVCRARRGGACHIVTSAVEHHAVLKTCEDLNEQGVEVTLVPVDSNGLVDPDEVGRSITPRTVLISVMAANNETGVIQRTSEIGKIARQQGIPFHVDAVQALGKVPFNVENACADLVSLSAHKIYGPKGIGALYVRKGTPIAPVVTGGSQERGMRAGTENVAAAAGFARAAVLAQAGLEENARRLSELRDFFEQQVLGLIEGVEINGQGAPRVPNTTSMSFAAVDGESILLHLDLRGICASTGSACATGSAEPSHVMRAMGIEPQEAQSTIRFSLGGGTTREDLEFTARVLADTIGRLRAVSSIA
jgi:cysteine desulfurase